MEHPPENKTREIVREKLTYETKMFWKVRFIISEKFTFPVVLSVVEQLLRSGNRRGIVSLDSEAHFLTFFSFRVELNSKLFSDKQKKISILLELILITSISLFKILLPVSFDGA